MAHSNPPTIRTVEDADRFVTRHAMELWKSGKWYWVSCMYSLSRLDSQVAPNYIKAVREFAATLYPLQEELPV